MKPARPRIAFYAPMKSPNHPNPSGDREIARLTQRALSLAGIEPVLASELRSLEMSGDTAAQLTICTMAEHEIVRLAQAFSSDPPDLWFTYHCYYKAPDLIGPQMAKTLDIPYVISEPSISPNRRDGSWAEFSKRSEAAIEASDVLLWTTHRDRPALAASGYGAKMRQLPAFVDAGSMPLRSPRQTEQPVELITVAMMRPGDKMESYRRLADALGHLDVPWRLTIIGDGEQRADVEDMFAQFGDRLRLIGQVDDRKAIRQHLESADIFVWPGIGEGVGMVYLEAQAAGLPVVAEDHAAASELVAEACTPPEDPRAYAGAIARFASPDAHLVASKRARAHIEMRHSIDSAASILRETLTPLIR